MKLATCCLLLAAAALAAGGCTVHLVTIQLPAEQQREATTRPSGSFLDRVIEDLEAKGSRDQGVGTAE